MGPVSEMKPPAMPFFARDFLQSKRVRRMTLVQVAFYVFLLLESWDNDPVGYLPEGFELWKLARAESKADFEAQGGQFVLDCFERDQQGRLYSPRLVAIREEQENYRAHQSESGKLGAKARWHRDGEPHGDPHGEPHGDPMATPMANAMANPMASRWPSSASSSASSLAPSSSASGLRPGEHAKKQRALLVPPPEAVALAEHLRQRIVENNPQAKITASQLNGWADDVRLMLDRDHRDPAEVRAVIDWCQRDEFWKANILSASKLRKQFDQLRMKMLSSNGRGNRAYANKDQQRWENNVAAGEEALRRISERDHQTADRDCAGDGRDPEP